MGKIQEFTISDAGKWDEIIRSFPDYDVFYLSGYAKAFMNENPENGLPVLLLYEDGTERAINVVFRRDVSLDGKLKGKIPPGKYFDLITPYGYGGFWGNVSDWEALHRAYTDFCKEKRCVCEFVRFELFSDYAGHYDGTVETRTHNVVRSLSLPLEDIWMDFRQKVRKNVKKANSSGLRILMENSDEHLEDFIRIYNSTMKRTEADAEFFFSREFYDTILEMKENIMFFYTAYQNQIISAELVLYGSENVYSFLGGTDEQYFDLRPNDFLKYEIIKWAKGKGLKNFVLGGGYGADDGIFKYKYCLAPQGVTDYYIGKKIFDEESYQELVSLRSGDTLNPEFFPAYRS